MKIDNRLYWIKVVREQDRIRTKRELQQQPTILTKEEKIERIFTFFFIISFFLYSIDIFIIFIIYPLSHKIIGLFGCFASLFLIFGLVFLKIDLFINDIKILSKKILDLKSLFFIICVLLLFVLYCILFLFYRYVHV